jgi:hypothetical protein
MGIGFVPPLVSLSSQSWSQSGMLQSIFHILTFQVDFTLSFLDNYVSESLMAGACPYKPKYMRYKQTPQEQGMNTEFT